MGGPDGALARLPAPSSALGELDVEESGRKLERRPKPLEALELGMWAQSGGRLTGLRVRESRKFKTSLEGS